MEMEVFLQGGVKKKGPLRKRVKMKLEVQERRERKVWVQRGMQNRRWWRLHKWPEGEKGV